MAFKLYDVIEYQNEMDLLVYKHPCENFNTKTKLVVREGQMAVFIKNGQALDIFSAGRYKLSTENIPIIRKIMAIPTGGECSFTSEIYFLNCLNIMNVKWGTITPMELQDPIYKVIVRVGASGESMFKIADGKLFIKKILGMKKELNKNSIGDYFKSLINMYIKNAISDCIALNNISIMSINSCLLSISKNCNEYINKIIQEYGLIINNLTLENIMIPNDDLGMHQLKKALNKKAEMDIVGYTYQEERSFDVMETAAKQTSSVGSGFSSQLINLGMGLGVAAGIGNVSKDIVSNLNVNSKSDINYENNVKELQSEENVLFCFKCGYKLSNNFVFCPKCGTGLRSDEQ